MVALTARWKAAFGEAPAPLVILTFCFLSALAGFVATVSFAYYDVLPSAAPLVGSALGALIGASATVSASIYIARRAERRAQLVALEHMLLPLDELGTELLQLRDLLSNRLKPDWNGHAWLAINNMAQEICNSFAEIRPVPGAPREAAESLRVRLIRWRKTLNTISQEINSMWHAGSNVERSQVEHAVDTARELASQMRAFAQTSRNDFDVP